jgi:putative selenate reductase
MHVILRTNPFPNVCGMVCDHLCQSKCTRVNYDDPLLIREIKRYINDSNEVLPSPVIKAESSGKAAIIGAGPSGLACAWFLRQAGVEVTVYEAKNLAGGMVADAIPAFRLSDDAIQKDIERILESGVVINYNYRIDTTRFNELRKEAKYVYLAIGAERARKLGIQGEDLPGVLDPLVFLSDFRRGKIKEIGKEVMVIGGGNTAMDVARTCRRLGGADSKVHLLYRRTRNEMPAHSEEVEATLRDGIELIELVSPVRIVRRGSDKLSLVCRKMQLSGTDAAGRPKPVEIPGSDFELNADLIIPAAGQEVNAPFFKEGKAIIDADTYETQLQGVFMAGDAYSGGASIIRAIGEGRKVAETILKRMRAEAMIAPASSKSIGMQELMTRRSVRIRRKPWEEGSYDPHKPFALISKTMDAEQAVTESSRCLFCDELCNICVTVCPNRANTAYTTEAVSIPIYSIEPHLAEKNVAVTVTGNLHVDQEVQVFNIADFCNECGNCATFCPSSGKPYTDKPRICLSLESFKKEENAYYLSILEQKTLLLHRKNGSTASLEKKDGTWHYEDENMQLSLNDNDYGVSQLKFFECDPANTDSGRMASMIVLFTSLSNDLKKIMIEEK